MDEYELINQEFRARAPGWVAVKPIRSENDYAEVLVEIQRICGATEGSTDYDLLAVLVALATAWEADQGKE